MSAPPRPTLSVVVVTRNEAANVADCLESVLALCREGPSYEVILVDSNSTDDSVSLATDYPVTVLRIPDDELTSPGAGRYVGTTHACGDYILFVDGDMQLTDGWLADALELVRTESVAGVTGHLNDRPADERADQTAPNEVDALRGVALYDAAILDDVGGFDPYLQASEDTDVGFRLRAAGYDLYRLPTVVATHPDTGSLSDPVRRWRRGYFHGVGQAVRKGASDPGVLARHVLALRHSFLAAGWLGLGLLLAARSRRLFLAWTGLSTVAVACYAARTGTRRTLADGCAYLLTLLGVVLGGRQPPPPADEYPVDRVELVQAGPDAT